MDFNYRNAYIGVVTGQAAVTAFAEGEVLKSDVKVIGVASSESGYKIDKEQVQKSSTGEELVLTWKLEINLPVLTAMSAVQKALVDGQRVAVVFIPSEAVSLDYEDEDLSDVTLPGGLEGIILTPVRTWITEDEQFGSGEVRPIVITGEQTGRNKNELRKAIIFTVPD